MATSIVHPDRIRVRRSRDDARTGGDLVVYWMHRSQRAVDNPALEQAIRRGNELGLPVAAVFEGLADVERSLSRRGLSLEV
ncbi:MAG: deoxyribodipyrimidine photo-lyase [Acidimicrobiales bacterium]